MSDNESDVPSFKHATIQEVFKLSFDPTTRINGAALHLSAEYLRLFTIEALHRSAEVYRKEKDAAQDGSGKGGYTGGLIEVRHLEKIMAGLLLDF